MVAPLVICLMGPTASGKTQLAIELTEHFPVEIISVDSAMVYRGMDIGTAKPAPDVLKRAPHRLLDIRDPADAYSAAQFREDALREINDIISQGKIPLLVGGTMMYFRALQKGLSDLPSADTAIREEISNKAQQRGWPALHEDLLKIDPIAANRIHPHDSQRIQRALEVYALTGKSLTACQEEDTLSSLPYPICNIAIAPSERSVLHDRIAARFSAMLAAGFLDEVRRLFDRGDLTLDTPAIRSVGYRQAWEYFLGKLTYEAMREKGIVATRQLAKRQLTWLRHWSQPVMWFDSESSTLSQEVMIYVGCNIK